MPSVITEQSTIQCLAGGTVQAIASQTKLKVGGAKVLVQGDLDGATIAGCGISPSPTTSPCTATITATAGTSTRLKVGGKAVLLDTTLGNATGLAPAPETFSVQSAGQSALTAI